MTCYAEEKRRAAKELEFMKPAERFDGVVQAPDDAKVLESPALEAVLRACRKLPRGKGAVARVLGRAMLGKRLFARAMPTGFDMLWSSLSIEQLVNALTIGWDEDVLLAIKGAVKPGGVFYDVGANAGYMSLSLAKHEPTARIFSFEPLPPLAGALAASARRNGFANMKVVRAALTDSNGPLDFYLPSHSIHASLISREDSVKPLRVEGFRLDTLIDAGSMPPPDVMKIDVEGAEMHVFRGAEKTLEKFGPTLIFECDENAARFDHSPDVALQYLEKLGYNRFSHLQRADLEISSAKGLHNIPAGDFMVWRENL